MPERFAVYPLNTSVCFAAMFTKGDKFCDFLLASKEGPELLCSHSPNDDPLEPQRNVSIAAARGAVRPSNVTFREIKA